MYYKLPLWQLNLSSFAASLLKQALKALLAKAFLWLAGNCGRQKNRNYYNGFRDLGFRLLGLREGMEKSMQTTAGIGAT